MDRRSSTLHDKDIKTEKTRQRFWEIDFLRGLALIMMVVFHFLVILHLFGVPRFRLDIYPWFPLQRATMVLFLLLVGVSLTLARAGLALSVAQKSHIFLNYAKRGISILTWAMLITGVSRIMFGDGFVRFGILHLIGLSMIISLPFISMRVLSLILGTAIIVLGYYIQKIPYSSAWQLGFGIIPQGFYSMDYAPVIPWFGVVLIGIFIGNFLYLDGQRRFLFFPDYGDVKWAGWLCYMGRHSLVIYLIHMPILFGLLWILGIIRI